MYDFQAANTGVGLRDNGITLVMATVDGIDSALFDCIVTAL